MPISSQEQDHAVTEKKPLPPDVLISGTTIRLLALETTKSKWTTILIGARPGRYLIVEMPKMGGAPVKLDDGTKWAVNFISKGAVYSFNSEILGYTYRLVPLLFLSYPQQVEVANLRNEKRYPVNIPAISKVVLPPPDFKGASEEENGAAALPEGEISTLVVDISEGGFMMISPVALPPETTIEAVFHLPQGDPIAGLQAVVKTCRGKPGGFLTGLSLAQSNPPEAISRLGNFITSIENMPLRL